MVCGTRNDAVAFHINRHVGRFEVAGMGGQARRTGRACSRKWDIDAQLARADRDVKLVMPRLGVRLGSAYGLSGQHCQWAADYFRGTISAQTDKLDRLLRHEPLAIGDLDLTEVLQGFHTERDFNEARKMLTSLMVVELGGREIAIQAAKNFRVLRRLGMTLRKTIDTVIATRCIESGYDLLHDDRDFDPFARHLGLRVVV